MKKAFIALLPILLLVVGCQPKSSNQDTPADVKLTEIIAQAPGLVDHLVKLEGTVMHVCRESGKRMFLGEENFKVLASDKIGRFDVSIEGSDVIVTGFLREDRINESYLDSWEEELNSTPQVPLKEAVHTGEGGHNDENESATETQLKQIQKYREQIAAGDKGYLSFYSLEITDLEEVK